MKKGFIFVSCVLVFLLAAIMVQAQAQDFKSNYGVTVDSVYYVSKTLVDKAEGNAPKVMYGPSWAKKDMQLVNGFYVYKAADRKVRAGIKTEFCFDIGGNRFLPHALVEDSSILPDHVTDNGVGGYNFRMTPQ